MLYALLIVLFSIAACVPWFAWVDRQNLNTEGKVLTLFISIPFIPAIGWALAALTIYALSKLGLISGYFGL